MSFSPLELRMKREANTGDKPTTLTRHLYPQGREKRVLEEPSSRQGLKKFFFIFFFIHFLMIIFVSSLT
jgi:hypothetical protein